MQLLYTGKRPLPISPLSAQAKKSDIKFELEHHIIGFEGVEDNITIFYTKWDTS